LSNSTLDINESKNFSAKIYPNPCENTLKFDLIEESEYQISTIEGKIISFGKIEKEDSLDISKLNSGIYYVKVNSANNSNKVKVLKFTKKQ
jgi:hypothetical protein